MPFEITVGPPQIAIHDGQTVWASDPDGQLRFGDQKGLLFYDTRMISNCQIFANGEEWKLLNGAAVNHFAARIYLTNPPIPAVYGDLAEHTLGLSFSRWIDDGVHEDIEVTNHAMSRARFNLEMLIRCDFADIFEIRKARFVRRGKIRTDWSEQEQRLHTEYVHDDFRRCVSVHIRSDPRAGYANGRLTFDLDLAPGETWHACLLYDLSTESRTFKAPEDCLSHSHESRPARELAQWRAGVTRLTSANEEFYRLYQQAIDDLVALRLPIENGHVTSVIPAAGLPWFVALFGRDSLIVSLQTAPVTAEFGRGALEVLGGLQAKLRDDYRDAEPGKILHEMRRGELAHFKEIPHTPYYGTADATPLYLMVLHSVWRWTGDRDFVARQLDVAEGCLAWIDDYGDRDGDGFQEYQTRSSAGYENVGWKDSGDGVLYEDGTVVKGPKALCELQGYVYAAWVGMAEIFDALGRAERAGELRAKAARLFDRFNEAFWDEAAGFYAFALDGDKNKVMSIASNPGHCLWTGIVRPDRAQRVVDRLMAPDMFTGWGIRTLSAKHFAFNPYSYHNGSVWPHDNGLIALGMKRYGFAEAANRIARGVSGAGAYFALHQLPELYAGIQQDGAAFPVQYLGANVPQAWAAGSVFALVRAILGLQPDAPNRRLMLEPVLPAWLPDLRLSALKVGDQTFDIRFRRVNGETVTEVLGGDPGAVVLRGDGGRGEAAMTP